MRNFRPGRYFLAIALAVTSTRAIAQDSQDPKPPGETPNLNPLPDARDRIYYPGDTESIKPLAKKLFGNVLLDQKEIWTSPFHMHKSDAKWWILFGAATTVLIATDRDTSTIFENSKSQVRWAQHISNIGSSYTLAAIDAGFYAYGILRNDSKAREVAVLGGEALIDSLIVVEVLKLATGRNRPNAQHEPSQFFDGGSSFPSGHAIASWALASVVAHEYGRGSKIIPIVAYSLATLVSGARFAAQQHYASDILVGAGMGWFIGRFVYQTHMNHAIHKYGWLRPQIRPEFNPSSRTYAAALVFGNH
jgi:membrane-associated phospholipid phosphatase